MAPRRRVSATREVAAPASAVFALLADPRQHRAFDGSGSLHEVREGPERLFLGATFAMNMKIGVPYFTRNVVVDFVENKTIAWHHVVHCVWRYELEEVPGGTQITESFSYDNPAGLAVMAMGFPERNRRAMEATLERLEALVTS
ncbi:MAG TPA: SRPBCC family protein [Acidimicrobiales bacterium]|nr:SRPBCC family protein [Acidimicrobiales bacterium]